VPQFAGLFRETTMLRELKRARRASRDLRNDVVDRRRVDVNPSLARDIEDLGQPPRQIPVWRHFVGSNVRVSSGDS
jgi:hypothetical protein